MQHRAKHNRHRNRLQKRELKWEKPTLFLLVASFLIFLGFSFIPVAPVKAFGGVVWVKHGIHYLNNDEVTSRTQNILAPLESEQINRIKSETHYCQYVQEGFCQQSPGVYEYKKIVSPEIKAQPGTPAKKVVTGYCTICNDGTYSPSCSVGRGSCSWHDGVSLYDAPVYQIIPGTPSDSAQPAVYAYSIKTYKDSPYYIAPKVPDLKTVVGF